MKYTKEQIEWAKNELRNNNRSKTDSFKIISNELGSTFKATKNAYYNPGGWLNDENNIIKPYGALQPEVCLAFINKHPDNLSHAFRLASKETNQPFSRICKAYYSKGANLYNLKQKKRLFNIVGFFNIFKNNMKNNIEKGKTSL